MRYLNESKIYDIITNFSIGLLLIVYFYKINLLNFIPVTGDELNSILVYSTNTKYYTIHGSSSFRIYLVLDSR